MALTTFIQLFHKVQPSPPQTPNQRLSPLKVSNNGKTGARCKADCPRRGQAKAKGREGAARLDLPDCHVPEKAPAQLGAAFYFSFNELNQ
jgi:hypothetical protein